MVEMNLEVYFNGEKDRWELVDEVDNVLLSVYDFDVQRIAVEETKEHFAAATLLYEKLLVKLIGRLVSDIAKED